MKKRVLSFILILCICTTYVSTFPLVANAKTYDIYTYTVSNGEVTITDCEESASGNIAIPSTIDGYPVITIGREAFSDCASLTNITIPDSVITIGDGAFYSCTSLTNVTIPKNTTTLGKYSFRYCSSLTCITISDSVTSIGNAAFWDCTSLTNIYVDTNSQHYSSADGSLFNKNKTFLIQYAIGKKNTSYTIPDSVTTIGGNAFYECKSLTNITIPNNVTSINEAAFCYCTSLESIIIPDSVTTIGELSFHYCTNLKNVYYTGNETEWKSISIDKGNEYLTHTTIYYNYKDLDKFYYNNRKNASDKVSVTIMKNNKDMTDSDDKYVEHITTSFSRNSKTDYEITGYYKQQIDTSNLSDGDKVYLEKSGINLPLLGGVYLDGVDVRRDELVIGSDFTGQLTAQIDWNGQNEKIAYIDNGITQLKLTDGKTEDNINWGNFIYNSRGTYIVLKTTNGYTTKKKLNIVLQTTANTPDEIELNVFDSVTGVGSGVLPYLDDLELSFDIPNFKLDFSVDPADNSVRGVFGVDVAEWAYENDLRDDKKGKWDNTKKQNAYKAVSQLMKDTFKEMQKNKKDQKTLKQEYKKLTKQLGKAKQKTTAKFGFDAGVEVMGYVEGKVDHNGFYLSDGGIIVKASIAGIVSGEGVIWVIPYNWKLGGSADANLNLQIAQREIRAQKLTPQGSVAITIGANGEGGPGLKKVHLNLGVAGSLTPAWQFAPNSAFTLDGAFSIYIDATAWAWSFKKDFFETSYRFYPRAKTVTLMSINDLFSQDTYSLRERKYQNIPSEFVANDLGVQLFSFDEHTKADKIIKTNSYDVSTPQYVELSDGRKLLVWLDDDTSRSVINGTSIMYSVNDGETWSEPKYVQNDGSGDYSPKLKVVGDNVYLVWENIDVQADNATMEQSLLTMDIKCAEFDATNNKFVNILQLTNDNVIDSTPEIGISDGDLIVSWIKNTSSDVFETGNNYSIEYAVISDGEIRQQKTAVSGTSSIDSHIAKLNDGVVDVYYIYDTDSDLSDIDDNVLSTTQNSLNVNGNVSGLCSFDNTIYYYNNGNISTNGESIGVSVHNNNYIVTNGGKTVLFTTVEDMTSEIYACIYDEQQSVWGEPVRITNMGCKITDINGCCDDNGNIHLAFNKKNLAQNGADTFYSTSDLAVLSIVPSYNITLKDVYTENSNLLPGENATLHIEVYNAGERTVDTLAATVYDNAGNVFCESDIEAKLLPGVTGEYNVTYKLPEDFEPSEITVQIDIKDEQDYDTTDNSMDLMLDFNNLAVNGINSVMTEEGYSINAVITNTGFSEQTDIEVCLLKDGEIVQTKAISNLDSLQSKNVSFVGVDEDCEYTVRITEKDNEDILVDNEQKITVIQSVENHDTEGYIKELDYAEGKITATISMFNTYEQANAYLLLYDGSGNLLGIDYRPVKSGEKEFELSVEQQLSDTQNYSAELVLWSTNLKPFMSADVKEIVTAKTIVVDTVLESEHNYPSSTDKTYTYIYEGNCESIDVTFTSDTQTESGCDYIYIYDANDNQIGKYSGASLAGVTVNVPGNILKIRITSDGSVTRYGFKTQSIVVNR